ncbi:MAG: Uncharacterized protein CEO21_232 [Microgenomates group bacterium Gr01-1014_80]|nr:MAG: Uncharacterized protein CEO21_232 [Microgenomates group bacterium Gr01-1014_80]
MKFIADVNIAQSVIRFLRNQGHEVLDTKRDFLREPDIKIIKIARNEARIILTRDKDFIVLVKLPKYKVPTIVFRLTDQKPENIKNYLEKLLENTEETKIVKSLTIIEDDNTDFISLSIS